MQCAFPSQLPRPRLRVACARGVTARYSNATAPRSRVYIHTVIWQDPTQFLKRRHGWHSKDSSTQKQGALLRRPMTSQHAHRPSTQQSHRPSNQQSNSRPMSSSGAMKQESRQESRQERPKTCNDDRSLRQRSSPHQHYQGIDFVKHSVHPDVFSSATGELSNKHSDAELYDRPLVRGIQSLRSFSKGYAYSPHKTRNPARHGFDSTTQRDPIAYLNKIAGLGDKDPTDGPGKYTDAVCGYYDKLQWGPYAKASTFVTPVVQEPALIAVCESVGRLTKLQHASSRGTTSIQSTFHALHKVEKDRTELARVELLKGNCRAANRDAGRVPKQRPYKPQRADKTPVRVLKPQSEELVQQAIEQYMRQLKLDEVGDEPGEVEEFVSRFFVTMNEESSVCSDEELPELYQRAIDQLRPLTAGSAREDFWNSKVFEMNEEEDNMELPEDYEFDEIDTDL